MDSFQSNGCWQKQMQDTYNTKDMTPEVELENLMTGLVCPQNVKLIECRRQYIECRHGKPQGSEA